jgi:hypothetical protein
MLKQYADEKRRAERKMRHLQDDLRYALKKLPEPLDLNLPYEEVRSLFLLFFFFFALSKLAVGRAVLRASYRVQSLG